MTFSMVAETWGNVSYSWIFNLIIFGIGGSQIETKRIFFLWLEFLLTLGDVIYKHKI
jgi:hypothetical protein